MQSLQKVQRALICAIVVRPTKSRVASRETSCKEDMLHAAIDLPATFLASSLQHMIISQIGKKIAPCKATITRCDLSSRFICIDATLLCEFESDKI